MNTQGKFNPNENLEMKKYNVIKGRIAISAAIFLWIISIVFNAGGFNFKIPDKLWIGIGLGIVVTVMQFIGNDTSPRKEPALFTMCMIAYAYSVYIDIVGIAEAMKIEMAMDASIILPAALAAIIEITPEKLVIWALKRAKSENNNLFSFKKKKTFDNKHKPNMIPLPFRPVYNNPMDEKNERLEILRDELRRDNFERRPGNTKDIRGYTPLR